MKVLRGAAGHHAGCAKATGFSPATVSIVLNDAPLALYIASGTKKKIQETAKPPRLSPERHGPLSAQQAQPEHRRHAHRLTDPFCTPILPALKTPSTRSPTYPSSPMLTTSANASSVTSKCSSNRHVDGLIVVAKLAAGRLSTFLADLNKAEVPTVHYRMEIPGNRVSFAMVDNGSRRPHGRSSTHQLGPTGRIARDPRPKAVDRQRAKMAGRPEICAVRKA